MEGKRMSKKKILIIKGHGGNDCGAVANGLVEKTMNKITAANHIYSWRFVFVSSFIVHNNKMLCGL